MQRQEKNPPQTAITQFRKYIPIMVGKTIIESEHCGVVRQHACLDTCKEGLAVRKNELFLKNVQLPAKIVYMQKSEMRIRIRRLPHIMVHDRFH